MEPKLKIEGNKFYKRIEKIYKLWKSEDSSVSNLHNIIILRGNYSESEESTQFKTSLLHSHLLGYEFTDTLICFSQSKVIFYLFKKKKLLIENTVKPQNYKGPQIELIERNPKVSNEEALDKIFNLINTTPNQKQLIGTLTAEPGIGPIVSEFNSLLTKFTPEAQLVNCSNFIDEILSIKDNEELENMQISSKYSCYIMDYVIKMFESAIDREIPTTHMKISNDVKNLTEKPIFNTKFKEKENLLNIDVSLLEMGSLPILQSGGAYNLGPFGVSDNKKLSSDVIICKVNSRYKDYNSYITRSFMIDAQSSQQTNYKILYEAFNFLISKLVDGAVLSDVYKQTFDFIIDKDQNLKDNLPSNFGFSVGLESLNETIIIKPGNNKKISTGMVFYVLLSFENLNNEKGFIYSLQIGDTVAIKSSNREIYTNSISKNLAEINYDMEDEEEEVIGDLPEVDENNFASNIRRTRSQVNKERTALSENKRKEHQEELLAQKHTELKEEMQRHGGLKQRFDKNVEKIDEIQVNKKMMSQIRSYQNISNIPKDIIMGKIYVDNKTDTIILPIGKMMVPFHASLIKNISKSEVNAFSYLRMNFHIPLTGLISLAYNELNLKSPIFVKELSYKSRDSKSYANLFKIIKDLIKKVRIKEKEEKERSEIVADENLILLRGKKIQLNDVIVRPHITSKKTNGVLEAHQNGFRFISNRSESIEIIYRNVKHAFYQPCESELIVLIHFHLKNPIMIGKKKSYDVQFCREAGIQSDDLDIRRKGNDFEEYENELREFHNIQKINEEFHRFTLQVEELKTITFDMPFRDLIFNGVPHKSNVQLMPTVNCLVSLIELPFFVITLSEIELVYFERVSHSIKNFDLAIIFKDWNKPVQRITAIPIENLEMLKNWLDESDILFFEGLYNMNWSKVFETIKKDPEEWVDEGGWSFLKLESSNHNSDSEHDGDSSYSESHTEDEDESEYSEESEYSDSDVEPDELSDEGLSWGEMEKTMANEDKENMRKEHPDNQKILPQKKKTRK